MADPIPPDAVTPAPPPPVPAVAASPPAAPSWADWVRRDVISTILLLFIYFFAFRLLTYDLMPRDLLWPGAGSVAAGCQVFFVLCVLLRKRAPWLWPAARNGAVALFVAWHLFFFVFRNPLDLWNKPVEDWCARWPWWNKVEPYYDKTDRVTRKYGNFFGVEQGWKMFPPPLARAGYFLDADVTFSDGSVETVPSANELDLADHLRLGGWRQRKLDTFLMFATPEELKGSRSDDLPTFRAYVRWRLRRWHETHPDDPRTPEKVKLVRRRIDLPKPGEDPTAYPEPTFTEIGTFDADGGLR